LKNTPTSSYFSAAFTRPSYLMLQSCGNTPASPTSNRAKWTKANVKWTAQSFLLMKAEKEGKCRFDGILVPLSILHKKQVHYWHSNFIFLRLLHLKAVEK
jgi:hypothetical protein